MSQIITRVSYSYEDGYIEKLHPKGEFYSKLTDNGISEADYENAKEV